MNTKIKGYTVFELIFILSMIVLIIGGSVTLFKRGLIYYHRKSAQTALLNLADQLDQYYKMKQSFAGASLGKLNFPTLIDHGAYHVMIQFTAVNDYLLIAIPRGFQASDTKCGALTLTRSREKSETGTGAVTDCW